MHRVFGVAILLAMPGSAFAVGIGSTIGVDGIDDGVGNGSFRPTFDLVFDPVILQIHALDTLESAFHDSLYLGVDVLVEVVEAPIAGPWSGVVQPGGGVDLFADPDGIAIAGECRLGIQAEESAGFGVYVVPAIGFVSGDGRGSLHAGGALQVSAWFGL